MRTLNPMEANNNIGLAMSFRTSPNAVPLLILLVLSAAVRLPALSYPDSVVFDEIHFGSFASAYCCNHEYFFDPHPPHAKLLIAGVARLLGYRGGLAFEHIGQSYGDISAVPLRLAPALAGTLLPLVIFLLLRQLGASPAAAFFGGLLLVFDNAFVTHTRIISLDSILLVATFGALALYLGAERAQTARRCAILSFLSGCAIGMAVGTKFTGLAIAGLIGLCLLLQLRPGVGSRGIVQTLQRAGWLGAGAVLVYVVGWVLHFSLLTESGPGDIWGVPSGNLTTDIVEIHGKMFSAHVNLSEPHPYSSPWWSWPLMVRPIYFWNSATSAAKIYAIGNPLVWWGGTLLFLVVLVNLVLSRVTHPTVQPAPERERPRFWLPIVGFVASYAPLADVPRVLFMYHYFTPLIFSLILVVLWLDYMGWMLTNGLRHQRASYYIVIAVLVSGFVSISPLTYGLEAGAGIADKLFSVFPGWR
ncbi:MAG: phospholipid carrier-dependent glycosyltransferase [Thiogranum sp.]